MNVRETNALSDESLARAAQAGSVQAFGELVDRFEKRVTSFLLRRTGWSAEAEDLAQETFLRAWSNLARYRDEFRFSTWLFTIASRLAADHVRGRRRGQKTLDAARASAERRGETGREEAAGAARDGAGAVWSVAERILNAEQLGAMWLRYAGEMGIPEIAEVLGRSEVGVRVLLFRARQRIAKELGGKMPAENDGEPARRMELKDKVGGRGLVSEGARC